jgi:hypothetical protein
MQALQLVLCDEALDKYVRATLNPKLVERQSFGYTSACDLSAREVYFPYLQIIV